MCGRYSQTSDVKTLQKRFTLKAAPSHLEPRKNLTPGQMAPIIAYKGGNRMGLFKWGFEPNIINARAETIAEKPRFKKSFQSRRCLIPADGFYEWKEDGVRGKIPFYFTLEDEEPFAFAGIWEKETFTIITTTPNTVVSPIHNRMPVILSRTAEAAWLDPTTDPERLHALLTPLDADAMRSAEMSPQKSQKDLF